MNALPLPLRSIARALCAVLLGALSGAASGGESYVGRPVYSEPGSGLQLPPGCHTEPTWRARMGTSDLEVWVVDCGGVARSWFVRRSLVEMVKGNQARLRFQVLDERQWPGETAGDTVSVQCVGRSGPEAGYVVLGAKWRAAGSELRLIGARSVVRADPNSQKFVAASLAQVECTRHPDREAMLRRLQKAPR
ncbi:MAG: hypothetical protein OHK0044_13040 [Burkholderiaceae bacterium]